MGNAAAFVWPGRRPRSLLRQLYTGKAGGGAMQEKLPVALSALRESLVARAARMEVREAWQVAAHFGSVDAEVEAARTAVAVGEAAGSGVWEAGGAGWACP